MASVICVNSFRSGTGKTTVALNLAAMLAMRGARVGLLDANFEHPDLHERLGLSEEALAHSLSDYLLGKPNLKDAAHDMTSRLGAFPRGALYLVPAASPTHRQKDLLEADFDPERFREGVDELLSALKLDAVVVDARGGLDAGTLPLLVVCDIMVAVMSLDRQDYQGTGVLVDLARRVEMPHITIVVNSVAGSYEVNEVRAEVGRVYDCQVSAVVPHVPTMATPGESGIQAVDMPDNAAVLALEPVATLVSAWKA
ncbi:MAG: P-loop NTPase [Anaerolineae bacterium]|nr:P-loop NTPase [Anaerolineae bacterium]